MKGILNIRQDTTGILRVFNLSALYANIPPSGDNFNVTHFKWQVDSYDFAFLIYQRKWITPLEYLGTDKSDEL